MASDLQHTLAQPCEFDPGVGLHTGRTMRMVCRPAPADHGVRFCRVDVPDAPEIPATLDSVAADGLARRTALEIRPGVEINTVEHLLAACLGLGIDNLRVELDGPEVPLFDGSAAFLVRTLLKAGLKEQRRARRYWTVARPFVLRDEQAEVIALPSEGLRATYFADFPHPAIGVQSASVDVAREFREEVAPARTFCLEEEIKLLRDAGLIKGGDLKCAVVFGAHGPLNTKLLFPNEPARHKLLDLLGDLYLLGRPLRGHVLAWRSGHRAHAAFLTRLRKELE
ncbi:MAG: UDP-3-O-acyl-N-acetylglucosamine deacetylase [Candidatus Sumerlaeota bacterium]|nr:UDP-3-O-acyl-N-acetylglucosamine deacetylase [Candidatus Sumerlaeota bacterium]